MSDVTQILSQIESGDPSAAEKLLPLVYDELRRLAAQRMAQENPGQTLQPTALVHEAFVRLVAAEHQPGWQSRGHFFSAAAQAMRRILVDSSRRKKSLKRGGQEQCVEIEWKALESGGDPVDLLAVDEALARLAILHERKARLVELRFFSGLTMEQAASALGIAIATANRDWAYARAWLYRELSGDAPAE